MITGSDKASASRIAWIDAIKGLAIVLVVFGHVVGGINARGWLPAKAFWLGLYDFIYLFHMPVFFTVSGMLLADVARSQPAVALKSRVGAVLWPYVLWSVIYLALAPFMARFMLSPPSDLTLFNWLTKVAIGDLG